MWPRSRNRSMSNQHNRFNNKNQVRSSKNATDTSLLYKNLYVPVNSLLCSINKNLQAAAVKKSLRTESELNLPPMPKKRPPSKRSYPYVPPCRCCAGGALPYYSPPNKRINQSETNRVTFTPFGDLRGGFNKTAKHNELNNVKKSTNRSKISKTSVAGRKKQRKINNESISPAQAQELVKGLLRLFIKNKE